MMLKGTVVVLAMMAALIVGCSKTDVVTGTWDGTLYFGGQDSSSLKLVLTSKSGNVTGKVTAADFGWVDKNITSGTYVEDFLKELVVTADVGGPDGELILDGLYSTYSGPRIAGSASTNGSTPRTGTFVVTK
jgi:hypothetical protein